MGILRQDLQYTVRSLRRHPGFATAVVLTFLLAALGATQWMAPLLYQTGPRDPLMPGAVTLLLGAVAWAACLVPARGATRVDPMEALREG